jgi:hypothetical protein
MMTGAIRKAAIATGKKMAWNMNFEGTGPSKVVQSVVAEPSAASIAWAIPGCSDRLGRGRIPELIGRVLKDEWPRPLNLVPYEMYSDA